MKFLYGYSVAAELRPETRYDQMVEALGCDGILVRKPSELRPETPYEQVVEALGGHGELVRSPEELRPALERALAAGRPALVNVLTDPSVAYPRKANLA